MAVLHLIREAENIFLIDYRSKFPTSLFLLFDLAPRGLAPLVADCLQALRGGGVDTFPLAAAQDQREGRRMRQPVSLDRNTRACGCGIGAPIPVHARCRSCAQTRILEVRSRNLRSVGSDCMMMVRWAAARQIAGLTRDSHSSVLVLWPLHLVSGTRYHNASWSFLGSFSEMRRTEHSLPRRGTRGQYTAQHEPARSPGTQNTRASNVWS
ncbi:hypothetical protein BC828DRAFT_394574, partial [Blastocladiella britannica]